MCGRYPITLSPETYREFYGYAEQPNFPPRYNVAPTQPVPIVLEDRGERHFMRELVDGDLAANNGGWQWAASTGTDAQPWFRIFNPTTQGERFDPEGEYVRRWVPELARVPTRFIHRPWDLAPLAAAGAGVTIGTTYPERVVLHEERRPRTLAMYGAAR